MPHELANTALRAIRHYLETGEIMHRPGIPGFSGRKAGVFVSLRKNGALRGCIGTLRPSRENIVAETVHNAVSAASCDPRFPPVSIRELEEITCSVDVLSEPEPAAAEELDPAEFGVIVESGLKRGLLLPDIEGVDSVSEQIEIAKQKAGILPGEPFKLYRFRVERFR